MRPNKPAGFTQLFPTGERPVEKRAGFTLVEVLIVSVIIAIVSLAIFSTFANGLKIYSRINNQTTEEDIVIFCDRLGQDLRNTFGFSGIKFKGEERAMEFANIVPATGRLVARTVGKMRYEYNPDRATLTRFTSDYSAVYTQAEPVARQSLKAVASCVLSYYYYDSETKEYRWAQEWTNETVPIAVRIEMEFKDVGGTKLVRTFEIPARGTGGKK